MSNKAELLKKIKALADRGVDGERESAQTLLARLMEQYGISETELEEERRETAWFPYSVCDRCGSHLDYGETCECVKEAGQEERARNAENQKDQNRQVQNRGVLDRKAG